MKKEIVSHNHNNYAVTEEEIKTDEKERKKCEAAYQVLYYSILDHRSRIYMNPLMARLTSENVEAAIDAVLLDRPEIFWVDGGAPISYTCSAITHHVLSVKINYTIPKETYQKNIFEFEQAAEAFRRNLQDEPGIEKEIEAIRGSIIANMRYDNTTPFCHTAYGAFVDGLACCDGISRAAQYTLQQDGYQAVLLKGTVQSNDLHAWLCVGTATSQYYVDFTYALSHPNDTVHWYSPVDDTNSMFAKYYQQKQK